MDIPLIYTVNETSYMVKYSLVGSGYGKESAPFKGNITLYQVPIGVYLLTVYNYNNMSTYAVSHFHVENPDLAVTPTPTVVVTPTPSPEPISPPLIIAVVVLVTLGTIALVAVICAGLLAYYRKLHKDKSP